MVAKSKRTGRQPARLPDADELVRLEMHVLQVSSRTFPAKRTSRRSAGQPSVSSLFNTGMIGDGLKSDPLVDDGW
jgi:hypothetical protein